MDQYVAGAGAQGLIEVDNILASAEEWLLDKFVPCDFYPIHSHTG